MTNFLVSDHQAALSACAFQSSNRTPAGTCAHQAQARTWQPYLTAVGSFVAVNGVDISAEVPGIIKEIYFESGQVVNKNDPLVSLDDDVDQADLRDNLAQIE